MIQRVKVLSRTPFVRNVAIVTTGTAGAQVITMAFSPIITRLYGPEAFGLMGMFMAILVVLTPIAALTYPIAIVLPKDDGEATALAKLSILLAFGLSAIALVLILIWGNWLALLLSAEGISQYLWLIPFSMLFAALHQVLEQWLIRHKQFKVTARIAVIQSAILNSTKAGVGVWYPLAVVLIMLQTLTSGFYALLLWLGARNINLNNTNLSEIKTVSIKALAFKYRDFPLFRAPEVVLNAASQGLPILMLSAFFGPASAGYYTLSRTVMGIPAGLIGKSIGDVFYPYISEAANNGDPLYPPIKKATLMLAAVGIIPFGLIMSFGPRMFEFVFGAEWAMAGEYARWLAFWMLFGFIAIPSIQVIPIIKRQRFFLFYTFSFLLFRALAIYIGWDVFGESIKVVALFSCVGVLFNMYLISFILLRTK